MTQAATNLSKDGKTLTVRVPFRIEIHRTRKLIIVPPGSEPWAPIPPRVDNVLVKAIARAHRWRGMIESGKYSSVGELAKAEKINFSYVCRILRLTLVSPKIIETILDGGQAERLKLDVLCAPLTLDWMRQEDVLLGTSQWRSQGAPGRAQVQPQQCNLPE